MAHRNRRKAQHFISTEKESSSSPNLLDEAPSPTSRTGFWSPSSSKTDLSSIRLDLNDHDSAWRHFSKKEEEERSQEPQRQLTALSDLQSLCFPAMNSLVPPSQLASPPTVLRAHPAAVALPPSKLSTVAHSRTSSDPRHNSPPRDLLRSKSRPRRVLLR